MPRREVFALQPRVQQLHLPHGNYEVVLEPQYENPEYRIPHFSLENMYFGDDYGGYNIDYPHPIPPKPSKRYQQDAFVDLTLIFPEYGPRPHPKEKKQPEKKKTGDGFEEPNFDAMTKQYEQELFKGIGAGYTAGMNEEDGGPKNDAHAPVDPHQDGNKFHLKDDKGFDQNLY